MFSYKTLAENFDKNLRKYNTFKREMKINPQWIAKSYDERRSYISQADYITTQTLSGGNKFSQEELKNMVYAIEFLDEKSKSVIKSRYKTTWKTYLEKLF
jgi:DNA-directed RNA polymerase specialized sigma subunit